jgi:hypothetical protein
MRCRMILVAPGLLAGTLVPASRPAAGNPRAPAAVSGIRGVARVGPISPVERPGVPNSRPLAGAVITVQPARGGRELARAVTDRSGRFQLRLTPGAYLLVPLPPQPGAQFPIGRPQPVAVRPGRVTDVTVRYDSGIR